MEDGSRPWLLPNATKRSRAVAISRRSSSGFRTRLVTVRGVTVTFCEREVRASEHPPVQRTELGGGIAVPRIVLGTMAYGRNAGDDAGRVRVLQAAIDRGLCAIDTAPLYELGRAEEIVGRALVGRRDRAVVCSKVGLRWDGEHGEVLLDAVIGGVRRVVRKDSRPVSLRRDVEESLRRLRVERIDLCQIHHPDVHVPIADAIGALMELRREGKIGAIGVSNFDAAQLVVARAAGQVVSHQQPLSLLQQDIDRVAQTSALGIATLCYSPLAQGVLAGRGLGGALTEGDDRRWSIAFSPASLSAIGAAV
ncbi:MAG TPA: aldo/keto reductase, partial [Nannocystaceae bacterium]|nr:aldo/keto reductase [Nannocystaceae bacterium]